MTDTNRIYISGEWGTILLYGDTSNLSTGISALVVSENKIECYPNPASDFVEVKLPEQNRNDDLLVYNSTGQLIRRITAGKTRIDISRLAKGIYFVRVGEMRGRFVKGE